MAFWCYILRCADGKYYTGHTDDLERRIAEHMHCGYCDFTSRRLPVEVVWTADFPTREEALSAEMRVKKWSRAKKEALAAGARETSGRPAIAMIDAAFRSCRAKSRHADANVPRLRSGRTGLGDGR